MLSLEEVDNYLAGSRQFAHAFVSVIIFLPLLPFVNTRQCAKSTRLDQTDPTGRPSLIGCCNILISIRLTQSVCQILPVFGSQNLSLPFQILLFSQRTELGSFVII
jgi:hypothetical protein